MRRTSELVVGSMARRNRKVSARACSGRASLCAVFSNCVQPVCCVCKCKLGTCAYAYTRKWAGVVLCIVCVQKCVRFCLEQTQQAQVNVNRRLVLNMDKFCLTQTCSTLCDNYIALTRDTNTHIPMIALPNYRRYSHSRNS